MLIEEPHDSLIAITAQLSKAQTEIKRLTGGCNRMIAAVRRGLKEASDSLAAGRIDQTQLIIGQMIASMEKSCSKDRLN